MKGQWIALRRTYTGVPMLDLPPLLNEDGSVSFAAFGYTAVAAAVLVTGSLVWCWFRKSAT